MLYNANAEENQILAFWEADKTFEKSVSERPADKPYVFYDGPPFATGLPHYGHILSSVIKDVVPRYWTMKGYQVRRRWGWDCHGLPIESLIEKELKISGGKKQIEDEIGVAAFNEACRSKVLTYTKEWKAMVSRSGRWVEFDNAYKTMDSTYMESVWWSLKTIWDKGLIYEGRKVLLYCPRCETPVSKAEVTMDNSYKDITEESVYVKFKAKNLESRIWNLELEGNTYLLAWTTTPWTLPGNVALAINAEVKYLIFQIPNFKFQIPEYYIIAKDRIDSVMNKEPYAIVAEVSGSDLVGLEYEPLFDIPAIAASGKKAHYVAAADFVTTTDGTGIVHTAVIYGEDDYSLGVKIDLPMVPLLTSKGEFNSDAPALLQGQYFKKAEKLVKNSLEERDLLFKREQFTHSYPHCWRCETPLIYNAISAWFIDIQKIKSRLIELNEKINWYPDHLKHGRFLNILETAPDWNISRNRYWATALPFWKCDDDTCKATVCVGSVAELKEKATNFSDVFQSDTVADLDLHKQFVDQIVLTCAECGGTMHRVPEVIDCWVESGSMPFAEFHYPFENKDVFEGRFPGHYIAEYIAQTRAWFYYMHVMSTLLFDSNSFQNCVTTGTILNEKGEKLSKSKQNYPDPWKIIEQYGVDALRYYLMTSVVMEADNLLFNEREVKETYNKVINILWNVVEFYLLYAKDYDGKTQAHHSSHPLDKWILTKTNALVKEVTEHMDAYNTVRAGRPIKEFIDELSTWYVRRSRDRFKGDDELGKQHALAVLKEVLLTLAKVMAPFTPFIAEKIHQSLAPVSSFQFPVSSSVHLESWPKYHADHHDQDILDVMSLVRKIVELGLSLRAEHKLKVRQPLAEFLFCATKESAALANEIHQNHELLGIIADELNVKSVAFAEAPEGAGWAAKEEGPLKVWLQTTLTDQLKQEGLVRELTRAINQLRKDMGLTAADQVTIGYATEEPLILALFNESLEIIKHAVAAKEIKPGVGENPQVITIGEHQLTISLNPAS